MKFYSAKVKRSAPAVSGAHSYIHHPTSALQQDQQTVMRNILRPEEVQVNQDIGEHEAHSHPEANHDLTSAPLSTHATTSADGGNSGTTLQRSETNETEQEQQRLPEENELEETIQAKSIQPNFVDMRNTKPSGFDYARPDLKTQQANIHHILHSTGTQAKLIQCQSDNEEEEPIQTKHIQRQPVGFDASNASLFGYSGSDQKIQQNETRQILHPSGIQAKLSVGQADDKYEQEADRVASQVMAMPNQKLNRQSNNEEEDETVQAKSLSDQITPVVQRQEKLQAKGTPKIDDDAEQKIQQMRGQGESLPKDVQQETENKIGADFSNVNIHNNSSAHDLNKQVNARAFTLGNDVYFGAGEYAPNTNSGKQLLAHELTHVVQQNAGVKAKFLQRNENDTATNTGTVGGENQEYTANTGEYAGSKINVSTRRIEINKISLPSFKRRNQDKFNTPLVINREARSTTQGAQWDNEVDSDVRSHVTRQVVAARRINGENSAGQLFFYGRRDASLILFGNEETLINRFKRPFWDERNRPFSGQIDHIVEHQLKGSDTPNNYEFLEASANMSSGSRIAREIDRRIDGAVGAIRDANTGNTNIPRPSRISYIKNQYTHIQFNNVEFNLRGIAGDPGKFYSLNDIKQGKQSDAVRPMSEARLRRLGRTSSPLRIYASPSGGAPMPRLPSVNRLWVPRVRFMGWEPSDDDNGQDAGILSVDVFKSGRSRNVQLTKASEYADYLEEWPVRRIGAVGDSFINGGYLIPEDTKGGGITGVSGGARQSLRLPGMSPVQVDNLRFGTQGFQGSGRVLPTVPLIRDADIRLLIDGNIVELRKTFSGPEIQVPPPFAINNTDLTVFYGTRGLGIEGRVDFGIDRVGEGFLGAAVSTEGGFALAGEFNFDERIFETGTTAQVRVGYADNQWSMGGTITIPRGKVPGVTSATINVDYSEAEGFAASGEAELDVPGVESGRLEITHSEENGFMIGGEFGLSADTPGIRGGRISAQIREREDGSGYAVSASGTAQPDIPGIDSELTVNYNDGAFTAEVDAQYERGMLSGSLNAGVTNRSVNPETGELSETAEENNPLIVYGGGSLTIQIAPWLQGTAGVRFSPNGEITITGEIGLPDELEIFARKEINKSIFNIAVQAPIFPGIVAEIGGGLSATAGIGPGVIDQLRLGIEYNPDREQDTRVTGDAHLNIPADAGLRLAVRAGIGLGITGASATGGLEIGGTLGISGAAEAGVHVEWSPAQGLDLRANAAIHAQPSFKFDISGYVSVRALGFSVYDERWELASFTYGSDYRFGIRFPVHYREGQPFDISLNDVEFEVPDIDTSRLLRGLVSRIA